MSTVAGRSTPKLSTFQAEMPSGNKLEPASGELKLERSKTERPRHQNLLAGEEAQILDDKIPVQQKALLDRDCFLPNKAIDLIDEAGSRVRLRHAQVPEEARELEKEVRQITKEKDEAVHSQDFEKAGELRDHEMDLRAQIAAIVEKGKEMSKAETEAGDEGPMVHESDIRHIVSSWTGIPVEKLQLVILPLLQIMFRIREKMRTVTKKIMSEQQEDDVLKKIDFGIWKFCLTYCDAI